VGVLELVMDVNFANYDLYKVILDDGLLFQDFDCNGLIV
jgi:hypothetical protein